MAKNIPITARVSRGLFGQKATEPVLNVGQAGVYGNNITKGDPSPAKMMKSPLKQVKSESAGDKIPKGQATVIKGDPSPAKMMMKSPFKQVNKPKSTGNLMMGAGQAHANIGSKEPDTVVKGKEKTKTVNTDTYDGSGGYMDSDKWAKWLETPAGQEYTNKNTKQVGTGEFEPDKTIKGKDTTEKVPLTTFNEGSAKTSFWRRQDDRSVTHTSRKKKRADIQLAKLEAKQGRTTSVDKDGNEVQTAIKDKSKHVKEAKLKAKEEMWKSRQAGYQGSRDAAIKQSQQSVVIHGAVKGVNLDPKGQQILHANQIGNKKGLTTEGDAKTQAKALKGYDLSKETGTDTQVTNPATNAPAGAAADKKSVEVKAAEKLGPEIAVEKKTPTSQMSADDDPSTMSESPAGKSANGFFAKKSPLKMKYFK